MGYDIFENARTLLNAKSLKSEEATNFATLDRLLHEPHHNFNLTMPANTAKPHSISKDLVLRATRGLISHLSKASSTTNKSLLDEEGVTDYVMASFQLQKIPAQGETLGAGVIFGAAIANDSDNKTHFLS